MDDNAMIRVGIILDETQDRRTVVPIGKGITIAKLIARIAKTFADFAGRKIDLYIDEWALLPELTLGQVVRLCNLQGEDKLTFIVRERKAALRPQIPEQYCTFNQAFKQFGIPLEELVNLAEQGTVPIKRHRAGILFQLDQLQAYLRQEQGEAPRPTTPIATDSGLHQVPLEQISQRSLLPNDIQELIAADESAPKLPPRIKAQFGKKGKRKRKQAKVEELVFDDTPKPQKPRVTMSMGTADLIFDDSPAQEEPPAAEMVFEEQAAVGAASTGAAKKSKPAPPGSPPAGAVQDAEIATSTVSSATPAEKSPAASAEKSPAASDGESASTPPAPPPPPAPAVAITEKSAPRPSAPKSAPPAPAPAVAAPDTVPAVPPPSPAPTAPAPAPAVPVSPSPSAGAAATPDVAAAAETTSTPQKTSAQEAPELRRCATARYFKRMCPFKNFPLLVLVARTAPPPPVASPELSQATGTDFHISRQQPLLEIRPCFPGCLTVPPRLFIDATQDEAQAVFDVTPLAEGNMQRARIEIYQGDQLVNTITTPLVISKQRWAKLALVMGVVSPVITTAMELFQVNLKAQWPRFWHKFTQLVASWGGAVPSGLYLGGACLVGALLFYWLQKPRWASPVEAMFDLSQEQAAVEAS